MDNPVQPADLMQDSLTVAMAGMRKTVVKSSIPGLKGITVRKEKIILLSDIERLELGQRDTADAMSTYRSEIRLPNFKELLKELIYKKNNMGKLYPGWPLDEILKRIILKVDEDGNIQVGKPKSGRFGDSKFRLVADSLETSSSFSKLLRKEFSKYPGMGPD